MAFWGHIAEWGASTVAPAVVGLVMNAKEHAEQVGGQAAEWAANEVAPRAVGLAMEAQKHAEQVAEWGAKEVAPRAVGLAMEAQKHAEQVAPAVVGLAMNTKDHAEQISGVVAHWSTHHFVPAASGLAHNAAEVTKNVEQHYEQASPAERWITRVIVTASLTVVAEGFGIPLPKLLIGPILDAAGLSTGKAADGLTAESGAAQVSQPRSVVASLGPDAGATRKEMGNDAIGTWLTVAAFALSLENLVGFTAWL
ncbi:hypothetical protein NEUTE1DRAFT_128731 [Neurospora tetrasperma FGSC 2508]|uniref:Uncharacterized protein n=1 Tax=Neurospora tetrasperma (strain FGSC 2508 / ATCC MYA-4615 / P0657) TaxID=510951 RepID=F8MFT3_NEUT8|nr:uncharacterized protein NEUTE1DRAFT_128731 [Neurospora tetrasperma FGSC 2508]EGO59309.1 hypothetical protein NEUTE1DRAFT_128731 [Neurospora tetrasperma FGSC 2508]